MQFLRQLCGDNNQIISNISNSNTQVYEYFMPMDGLDYCIGCYNCFNKDENLCPHSEVVQTLVKSILDSDILIINSPTYCFKMTGQLKTFFDHLGYMWLSHRPNKLIFNKVALVISTASGAGANKVTKDLKQQMFWLGISNVFDTIKM